MAEEERRGGKEGKEENYFTGLHVYMRISHMFTQRCVRSSLTAYAPPDQIRLGTPVRYFREHWANSWSRLGQALAGALTMSLHCGVKLGTASDLVLPQPKPGPQFTILLGPGLGAKWRKKDVLFFCFFFSRGNWWDLNL